MAGKRVLVLGGNFGGLTAALELKHAILIHLRGTNPFTGTGAAAKRFT